MLRSFRAYDARYPKLKQIALGLIISLSISASLSLHVRADVTAAMGAKEDRASIVFVGSVQTVKTEQALFVNPPGEPEKWVEAERILTEIARYKIGGELKERTAYHPDGSSAVRVVRVYNDAGRLETEQLYNPGDSLWRKTTYTYNQAGQLTEAVSTDTDGDVWFRDVYVYNQAGQPSQVDHHDPDGSFLHRATYTYNPQGKIVERSLSDADGSRISSNVYAYETDGKLGKMNEVTTHGRNGSLTSRWIYAYDERGNEREWIAYKADGSIRRKEVYAYAYDARGNWVKQVTSEWIPDGEAGYLEPAEAVYQEITYYAETQVGPVVTDQKKNDEPQ